MVDKNMFFIKIFIKKVLNQSGFFVGNPSYQKSTNRGDLKSHGIFAKKSGIIIPKNPEDQKKCKKNPEDKKM